MKENTICPVSGESMAEEVINYFTHGVGFFLSIVGLLFLVSSAFYSENLWLSLCCIIYGITLALLYGTSTIYHSCKVLHIKIRLRVLDHVCIYLLIAGSYTPILFGSLEAPFAWIVFTIIWLFALCGSILKIFFTGRFVVLSTGLYLLMGWGAIYIYEDIYKLLSDHGFYWLMAGGLFYTFGVVFFLLDDLPYNHSIWHLFSMGGSGCHFYVIAYYIALA